MEQRALKTELDLKKAEAIIEKLQEQLRYSLSRHNPQAQSSGSDSMRKNAPERSRPTETSDSEQLRLQIDRLADQNQRLKDMIIRVVNSINFGLSKTLLEPLSNAVPLLLDQVAQTCNFSPENVKKLGANPIQPG